MSIHTLLFARLAELCGWSERSITIADSASIADLWDHLVIEYPTLEALRSSTRAACNAKVVGFDHHLFEHDEVAFLPPVGGG